MTLLTQHVFGTDYENESSVTSEQRLELFIIITYTHTHTHTHTHRLTADLDKDLNETTRLALCVR